MQEFNIANIQDKTQKEKKTHIHTLKKTLHCKSHNLKQNHYSLKLNHNVNFFFKDHSFYKIY